MSSLLRIPLLFSLSCLSPPPPHTHTHTHLSDKVQCLGMTLTYHGRLMKKSAMEPREEGAHPRLLEMLLRKRQEKKEGFKKKEEKKKTKTAPRKAKRRVTTGLGDAAVMRRNHSFISRHLREITTMAAPGCRWSSGGGKKKPL